MPSSADQRPRQVEDLGVDRRVLDAEHLDVQLVELAVTPLLRPLVPEHRADAVELRHRHRLLEAVLDEGAHDAGRRLGPEGDALAPLVGEGVHLLLDDVGGLAGALGEQFLALDDGRAQLGVPVPLEDAAGRRLDELPPLDLARQDVTCSADGWNHARAYILREPPRARAGCACVRDRSPEAATTRERGDTFGLRLRPGAEFDAAEEVAQLEGRGLGRVGSVGGVALDRRPVQTAQIVPGSAPSPDRSRPSGRATGRMASSPSSAMHDRRTRRHELGQRPEERALAGGRRRTPRRRPRVRRTRRKRANLEAGLLDAVDDLPGQPPADGVRLDDGKCAFHRSGL